MADATLEQRLLRAAALGEAEQVSELIAAGADVSYQEPEEGVSPLMAAAENGHMAVVTCLLREGAPW